MPDPIHELQKLAGEGVTVNPLSPSEVRRRGDRLRRRRTATTAIGAAAAVAVVATSGAFAGGMFDTTSAPGPADTPSAPDSPSPSDGTAAKAGLTRISPAFPLDVDHVDLTGDGGRVLGPSAKAPALEETDVCGGALLSAPTGDRWGFSSTGPEVADRRELRTFASADEAVGEMTRLRDLVDSCEEEPLDGGGSRLWTTYEADTGYESLAFGSTYDMGLGGEVYLVTRVGNAVLALSHSGEYAPESAAAKVPELVELAGRITPEMCVYTAAGCR